MNFQTRIKSILNVRTYKENQKNYRELKCFSSGHKLNKSNQGLCVLKKFKVIVFAKY